MKKIILSTLLAIALVSCKKEVEKHEESISTDSTAISEPVLSDTAKVSLKEISEKDLTEILSKNNDTLYVTNFFATWCGPCMVEIPHFKKKMEELKDKPIKFTFVNIYNKTAWETEVPAFAEQSGLADKIVLIDDSKLNPEFFKNFKQWEGNNIPFTYLRKGEKTDETLGSMSEETLSEKINSLLK